MCSDGAQQYPRSPYPSNYDQLQLLIEPEFDKEMHVHSYLAYEPYSNLEVPWDLSFPIFPDHYPPFTLQEPATQPPLQSLTVICPDLLLWDIPVKSSSIYVNAFVTVEDVLTAIYSNLRTPVNTIEYEKRCPDKDAVCRAFYARANRIRDPVRQQEEIGKGVKRVDFLKGFTTFNGLSVSPHGDDIWELNVS